MKKKNCRMTETERRIHDRAVRIRKMTDEQLCEYLNSLANYKSEQNNSSVDDFICSLQEKAGTGNGIGKATVGKIKEFAIAEGFIQK